MKRLLSYLFIVLGLVFAPCVYVNAEGDLDGFMNALEKAKNAGLTIDADTTAKQFGYKNFNEFFIHFKKENELSDLTMEDAKEFLLGSDNTVDIVESQENLDKLYDLIMNNKFFVKYQKKKNSYLNVFKKGKYKKDKIDQMALAVYIDYEKEMSKISKNPNLENITRFAWDWGYAWGTGYTPFEWALKGCRKEAKKYKLSGGECIIVDHRSKNPDKITNYLKPKLQNTKIKKTLVTKSNEVIKKQKDIEVNIENDNEPPILKISETITIDKPNYEILGKVEDSSDQLYVEIDGKIQKVNSKGEFLIKRYSPIDHQIKIVAIDKWGNKSKEKIINIKTDFNKKELIKIEPLNPLSKETEPNKNAVALIIGIEKYENAPDAKYANIDAKYFAEYAKNIFGIKENNIKLLVDEDANLSNTNSAIFKWLPSKIKENKTDLIVFYSGHGLSSQDGKERYILPSNADPDLLSKTALLRKEFFDQIISLNPNSVNIFFDTCYSGVSRDEETLLASARPIRVVADDNESKIPKNFNLFTASKSDQISSGLENAKHGIFSYYLMKGLEGNADINKDNSITNGELIAYLNENVPEKALDLGRQQNPLLKGDANKVLISYR